ILACLWIRWTWRLWGDLVIIGRIVKAPFKRSHTVISRTPTVYRIAHHLEEATLVYQHLAERTPLVVVQTMCRLPILHTRKTLGQHLATPAMGMIQVTILIPKVSHTLVCKLSSLSHHFLIGLMQ